MTLTKRDSRKQKMETEDRMRYKDWSFEKWEHSAHNVPGTPHRYFQDVFTVRRNIECTKNDVPISIEQVVHMHANGLAIVTAGNSISNVLKQVDAQGEQITVTRFEFKIDVKDSVASVGAKRKKARAMKNGLSQNEIVAPNDTLATLQLSNGEKIEFKCCMAGTLLETNSKLVVTDSNIENSKRCYSLLRGNPLLDGYLAIILPFGRFPSDIHHSVH